MNNSRTDEELLEFKMRNARIWGELTHVRVQIAQGLDNLSTQECLVLEEAIRNFRQSLLVLFEDVQKALGESVSRAFDAPPGSAIENDDAYFAEMYAANKGVKLCNEMSEVLRWYGALARFQDTIRQEMNRRNESR